jgi:hypothetical protein
MSSSDQLKAFIRAVVVAIVLCVPGTPVHARDDKEVQAILDKAIKALGGEEKLRTKVLTWKIKTGDDRSTQVTVRDLDQFREETEVKQKGKTTKYLTVVNGEKGWMKIDDKVTPIEKAALLSSKPGMYTKVIPVTILPLKGKKFKLKGIGKQKIDGKPAVGIRVTPPGAKADGKSDFTLYFDIESGLPVKLVTKNLGGYSLGGETIFSGYKVFDGIKVATKHQFQASVNGKITSTQQITKFQVLDKAAPGTFDKPK